MQFRQTDAHLRRATMFPDTEDSLTDIEFLNRIYYAAREGLAITVFALFSEKPTDVSKDLINRVSFFIFLTFQNSFYRYKVTLLQFSIIFFFPNFVLI